MLRATRGPHANLELVHRLDRDTSGCLLIAKRAAALRALHAQFRDGTVDKRYLALLIGRWPGRARTVDAPLLTDERRGGERHVRVDAAGKEAVTHFVPLERFPDAVLAEVHLATGRTHQIRVHAASIGHPVAGDERYGSRRRSHRAQRRGSSGCSCTPGRWGSRVRGSGEPDHASRRRWARISTAPLDRLRGPSLPAGPLEQRHAPAEQRTAQPDQRQSLDGGRIPAVDAVEEQDAAALGLEAARRNPVAGLRAT